jgi:vancomycin permeability regulator SanA
MNRKNFIKTNFIFVLAGGNKNDKEPNDFVKYRLDKAIDIFNSNSIIVCIGGGTYHKPPNLTNKGFVKHESSICAEYLIKKGIPSDKILREWSSYDTIANGFFAFTNFILPLNIKNFFIISSDFHIERAKLIFNYFNKIFNKNCSIKYISVESKLDSVILKIRNERELNSRLSFQKNIIEKLNDLESFSMWFYTKHNSYKSQIEYNYSSISLKKTY